MAARQQPPTVTKRKPSYPIGEPLRAYLAAYNRDIELPVLYSDLQRFRESIPLADATGEPTLWETVVYDRTEMQRLNEGLAHIYAGLRVEGDLSLMKHIYVDRIDYCTFGNSLPFRVRIVNAFNDNHEYFYIKKADASRIYGLELEHLLSPNRMHFFTCKDTLVEEHVMGIPGDTFAESWLTHGSLRPARVAKEMVKFNERCFVRLLGDMRSYNFVAIVVQDFDDVQIRMRAMDFDQQSYSGRKNFYLPQYFPENREMSLYCVRNLNPTTMLQYQREEQSLILGRVEVARARLGTLLDVMSADEISPEANVVELRAGLAAHYENPAFENCTTMGEIVRESLATLRRNVRRHAGPGDVFSFKD
ncbi:MAG TPA: hypothetical protein VMM36_19030 [Opitutaceae bacterium]|nr:hypothetical protein [Opitutaceae bacterium]